MDLKVKILIGILVIGIVLVSMWFVWKTQKYRTDTRYCESDADCKCVYGCGCYNFYGEGMECVSTREGLECVSKGCLCKNNSCGMVGFPIDSEEEAIAYARTDPDVKAFINGWTDEGFEVGIWATWHPINTVWEVGVSPGGGIRDILFLLHIKPNGTIIDKGVVPTA